MNSQPRDFQVPTKNESFPSSSFYVMKINLLSSLDTRAALKSVLSSIPIKLLLIKRPISFRRRFSC